jgi:hypothetical protein
MRAGEGDMSPMGSVTTWVAVMPLVACGAPAEPPRDLPLVGPSGSGIVAWRVPAH